MSSSRRAALALLLALLPGCWMLYPQTLYWEARVPPDATVDAIDHCLRTIALVNTADDPHAAALVSAEPDVVASWVSFELATRRELRAEASVRKHPGAWVIRFVGRGGGLGYDETLARAFASCMASHEPKLDVEVGKVTGRRLSW